MRSIINGIFKKRQIEYDKTKTTLYEFSSYQSSTLNLETIQIHTTGFLEIKAA